MANLHTDVNNATSRNFTSCNVESTIEYSLHYWSQFVVNDARSRFEEAVTSLLRGKLDEVKLKPNCAKFISQKDTSDPGVNTRRKTSSSFNKTLY